MSRFGDKEIRAFFEQARRDDEAAAPSLKGVLEKRRARRPWLRPAFGAGLAAAALLVGVLVTRWDGSPQPETELALSAWRSPTEFLLRPAPSDVAVLAPRLDGEIYPSNALRAVGWAAGTQAAGQPR